jgi:hypothetical protein
MRPLWYKNNPSLFTYTTRKTKRSCKYLGQIKKE